MVKLKRVYDAPSRDDGFRVLVDRLWPRGLFKQEAKVDLWLKDVAPSHALRRWFHHDEKKWDDFRAKYERELAQSPEPLGELRRLAREHRTLTLVFGAKDEERNQAVVLAGKLSRRSASRSSRAAA